MRPESGWARRTRHAVSLLVIGIVVLSLVVQAVAERLAPAEPTPSPDRGIVVAAGASPSSTAAPPTVASAAVVASAPSPKPAAPAPQPAPSATPTRPPSATATAPPPSPTPAPPTLTAAPPGAPTATSAAPTATSAPSAPVAAPLLAGQPRPATPAAGTTPLSSRVARVSRDDASRPAMLRAAPSVLALVIGEAPAGATVEVLGEIRGDLVAPASNRWLRVRYEDLIGYVYAPLVE